MSFSSSECGTSAQQPRDTARAPDQLGEALVLALDVARRATSVLLDVALALAALGAAVAGVFAGILAIAGVVSARLPRVPGTSAIVTAIFPSVRALSVGICR